MVAKGALGKYKPLPLSIAKYRIIATCLLVTSIGGGYLSGSRATGEWALLSWHPFLMTVGMVGMAGIGAVTKKLGGYTNTKLHALLGWGSLLVSFSGLYVVYRHKEANGMRHLQSSHSLAGTCVLVSVFGLGTAGSIFLHPDFGMDKTNKVIRVAHRSAARLTLIFAWITALTQLFDITNDYLALAAYGLPLLILVPFTLM